MSKLFRKNTLFLFTSLILGLSSCEKTVEIDPPINEITPALVFSSDKLATNALSGLYTGLASNSTQNTYNPVYYSLLGDDLVYTGSNIVLAEINANSYTILSTWQTQIFSEWYNIIYRANSIIEGLQKYQGTSEKTKKQLSAEAKAIRAYCYFNLVNSFGDVPLILTTDVTVTALLPRVAVNSIYDQIIKDLIEAKTDLPADYSVTNNSRLGVNKFVATALLARVYLFTGNYAAAEINSSEVIAASNLYSLVPKAAMGTGVWVKNNLESIWQMSSPLVPTNQFTVEGSTFVPSTIATAQYQIRPSFVSIFSTDDLRRKNWMSNITSTYVIPFKYKYNTQALAVAAGVAESQTVLRLAEQYLIRAEARARTGSNLTGARDDMNAIRARADVPLSSSTAQSTLLDEIILEGRKELFCEQAYRWLTLKRIGQADAALSPLKTGYRAISKLLPLPQTAIDANPNLVQNPGY